MPKRYFFFEDGATVLEPDLARLIVEVRVAPFDGISALAFFNNGNPILSRRSTYAVAQARAKPRTRPIYPVRSVTLIAPRASNTLNRCEDFMQ